MIDEEYQFSSNGVIEKNIAFHRKYNIEKLDNQFIVLFVGDTGSSKTSLSLLLEYYIRKGEVDLDTVCMSHEKFMQEYTTKPKRKIITYEEGRNSFDVNKYNRKETAEARDKINQFRKLHHTLFINFQNPNHLTKEILRNSHALLRFPEQGTVHYYSRPKIESMWDGNNFLGWDEWDARDFFPDPANFIPEIWREYNSQADDGMDELSVVSENEEEEDDSDTSFLSVSEFAERVSISKDTVRKWCDNGTVECKRLPNGHRRIPKSQVDEVLQEDGEEES